MTAIVEAFRRDRSLRDAGDKARMKSKPSAGRRGGETDWPSLTSRVTKDILQEMHFLADHISKAMQACGQCRLACVDCCLAFAQGVEGKPVPDSAATLQEESSAADGLRSLGYSLEDSTRALEECDFSLAAAIRWFLCGSDSDRIKRIGKERVRRQTLKYLADADLSAH